MASMDRVLISRACLVHRVVLLALALALLNATAAIAPKAASTS